MKQDVFLRIEALKTLDRFCSLDLIDRKDTSVLKLVDQLLVSAMGPPGGGRNEITPRFLRHFNIISIDSFSTETMRNIFSVIMDWHFNNHGFEMQIRRFSKVHLDYKGLAFLCSLSLKTLFSFYCLSSCNWKLVAIKSDHMMRWLLIIP